MAQQIQVNTLKVPGAFAHQHRELSSHSQPSSISQSARIFCAVSIPIQHDAHLSILVASQRGNALFVLVDLLCEQYCYYNHYTQCVLVAFTEEILGCVYTETKWNKTKRNENELASNRFQTVYTRTANRFEPFTRKRKTGDQAGVSTCWLGARAGSNTLVGVGTCWWSQGLGISCEIYSSAEWFPWPRSVSNRFHCFHRLHENENVLKTFWKRFGRCRVNGSSKRNDFVPFRSYFVVV